VGKDQLKPWKDLYEAAIKFRELKPWRWMNDSHILGVKDPESGIIGYCCVLGNIRVVLGLAVYMGTRGLTGYHKLQSGEIAYDDPNSLHYQDCLLATFEDKGLLDDKDLKLIARLGLKFKERWPMFRKFTPGYYPWFLDGDEARFLRLALENSAEVFKQCRYDKKKLIPPEPGTYLVRVPGKKGKKISWTEQWLEPVPEVENDIPEVINSLRIRKIGKKAYTREGVWEVDWFYFPEPVREVSQRPIYPPTFLWVSQDPHSILHCYFSRVRLVA